MKLVITNLLKCELRVQLDEMILKIPPKSQYRIDLLSSKLDLKVSPNIRSTIKINWFRIWLGSFLAKETQSKIVCELHGKMDFADEYNEIVLTENQSHPTGKNCFYSVFCNSNSSTVKDVSYSIVNRSKFFSRYTMIMYLVVSMLPLSIGCIIYSFLQEHFDMVAFFLGVFLMFIGFIPANRTHNKFKEICQDAQADYFLKLPVEQRSDIDKIYFEIDHTINSCDSSNKEKFLAKFLKKVIKNIEKDKLE